MKNIKYLRDYPLTCFLVKHYDSSKLYTIDDVPKEWLDLEIVHTYFREGLDIRILVVK